MSGDPRLCYLDAGHVEAPLSEFNTAAVLDESGHTLGFVDGVVVDPAQRRAIYLVIRRGTMREHRELLPIADLRIERERRALRLGSEPAALETFDPRRYPAFSDEDVITAMFADQAA